MRTATFKSVFEGLSWSVSQDPADLQADDEQKLLEAFNRRVIEGVEHEFFAELMRYERRAFRPEYDAATAYTAGTEVYYPAADAYYQALRATTGNAPATESGGEWTADSAYWAECAASYSADDWEDGVTYAAGDEVRNPADGEYYSCHTAHTAGGSFDATKFGRLTPFARTIDLDQDGETPIGEVWRVTLRDPRVHPDNPGTLGFDTRGSSIVVRGCWTSRPWVSFRIRPPQFTRTEYVAETAYAVGDLVYDDTTGECYKSLVDSNTGNAVTDATKWELVEFPAILRRWVLAAAKADFIGADGQPDAQKLGEAYNQLSQADDVATTGQGQIERATARSY
jgi:hypothetical protein